LLASPQLTVPPHVAPLHRRLVEDVGICAHRVEREVVTEHRSDPRDGLDRMGRLCARKEIGAVAGEVAVDGMPLAPQYELAGALHGLNEVLPVGTTGDCGVWD